MLQFQDKIVVVTGGVQGWSKGMFLAKVSKKNCW